MKKLYQRTFEQVLAQTCPPLNRVEEQRRALASRCSSSRLRGGQVWARTCSKVL